MHTALHISPQKGVVCNAIAHADRAMLHPKAGRYGRLSGSERWVRLAELWWEFLGWLLAEGLTLRND